LHFSRTCLIERIDDNVHVRRKRIKIPVGLLKKIQSKKELIKNKAEDQIPTPEPNPNLNPNPELNHNPEPNPNLNPNTELNPNPEPNPNLNPNTEVNPNPEPNPNPNLNPEINLGQNPELEEASKGQNNVENDGENKMQIEPNHQGRNIPRYNLRSRRVKFSD